MTVLRYPWWVRLGIWGSNSRQMVSRSLIGSATGLILCMLYVAVSITRDKVTSRNAYTFLVIILLLACLHFYFSRKWIDEHGQWGDIKDRSGEGGMNVVIIIICIAVGIIYPFITGWNAATIE